MPDGAAPVPVSVRLPADLLERLDKVAALMDRSRSWVILDALQAYLADEGQEVLDLQAGIEEVERGEYSPAGEVLAEIQGKIARAARSSE